MKTSILIVLCFSIASVIFAAEPPKPSQMHLIDRSRIQTNAQPAYRFSVAYDLTSREPLRYDYGIASAPSIRLP